MLFTLRSTLPLFALLPLLSIAGCGEEEVVCTEEAVSSVDVHTVGQDGVTEIVAEVTATDADGNPVEATCAEADATDGCSHWIVGWEVAGAITVHATANDGCNDGSGEATVTVEMDDAGCHVVTQELTLTLDEWTDLDCG